jgi:hypothetical protein
MSGNFENARLRGTGLFSPLRSGRTVAGALLLLLLAVVWFIAIQLPHEPVYGGKTLSVWLEAYDPSLPNGRLSEEWRDADDAVLHIGTDAIPTLLQMLCARDSSLKLRLVALAQKQQIVKVHFVPGATRKKEASSTFLVLGGRAKEAVLALMEAYEGSDSIESKCAIEESLGWIGPSARAALPLLVQAATNSNNDVRANAVWALGFIQAEPGICVPLLIHALDDSDVGARLGATHALGMFGSDARTAIPALMALTNPPTVESPDVWEQETTEACDALRKILPRGERRPVENNYRFSTPGSSPR